MQIAAQSGIALMRRLVSAAGWHSSETRFAEAIPHMSDRLSPGDLLTALDNLGVPVRSTTCRLDQIAPQDCPALFVERGGRLRAILDTSPSRVLACGIDEETPTWVRPGRTTGRLVRIERFGEASKQLTFQGFAMITGQFRGVLPWLVFASLMTNLMGLATPLLIMVIYDRVIPSGSEALIMSLIAAVAIVIASDACFRYARTAVVAHMGREIEQQLGLALFRKLLALPTSQVQRADVEQQIARFKQFEGLRDAFTGQVLTTLLDLPFTLLFCALLFILSPPVGLLIVGLMAVFIVATVVTLPRQQALNAEAARCKADQQSQIFETIKNQQAIQRLGLVDYWQERNASIGTKAAQATQRATRYMLVSQSFGQALMTVSGIGAVVLSTLGAMRGTISFGELIAIMSLVWKTLTPMQSIYANAPQFAGFIKSKSQSDRVLNLPEELVRGSAQTHQKLFEGRIAFTGVTHRYEGAVSYALSQVSLGIDPGDFVLIGGSNSSGKTSLLNLVCNLYQPVAGSIQLDGMDLRQIPVDDLRRSVTYIQPRAEFFYGTIFQNFRLASPTITEDEVHAAIEAMNLAHGVAAMSEGIHTRLTEAFRANLPDTVLKGLSIARGLSRPGSVLLLNEPSAGLDRDGTLGLANALRAIKGKKTVLLASQDPVHMEIADRFVYLERGRVVLNDKSSAGYRKFAALSTKSKDQKNAVS